MKNLLFTTFLLLMTLCINAQTETTNWLYNLEGEKSETPKIDNQNNSMTLKMLNSQRFIDEGFILGRTIEQAINNGTLTIYQDKKCTKVYPKGAAKNAILSVTVDTIITFDAENFEEEIKVIRKEVPYFPNENAVYELEQSREYDDEMNRINMRVNAVHVSILGVDAYGETLDFSSQKYLFSIKNEDLETVNFSKYLEKPSVIWAKEISYNGKFNYDLRIKLLSKSHLEAHKVVSADDRKPIFSAEEMKTLEEGGITLDTIVTFDPQTFKEKVTVARFERSFDAEYITSFRVLQDFYFDNETNTFQSRIVAIAPLRKVFDENSDLLYEYPILWVVYEVDSFK